MYSNNLTAYGLTESIASAQTAGLVLARVVSQSRNLYTVQTDSGQLQAQVAGRFVNAAVGPEDYPAVGDWVQLREQGNAADTGIVERLMPRTSVFMRKAAGKTSQLQVVAANVDVLFLCMALDGNFNLRRLERYLAVARDSGANACVVLTKADLARDFVQQLTDVTAIAGESPVIVCDATRADGWTELAAQITPTRTYAFLGSSGVGKTTLINRLRGTDELATGGIREADAHGRHTTTSRQLLLIPGGGVVLDTPGMRELAIMDADVDGAFTDITALAQGCKFSDCTHSHEPGCAVQAAIADGALDAARLTSYTRLQAEQDANQELRGRAREMAKINRMFGSKKNLKAAMRTAKNKRKR